MVTNFGLFVALLMLAAVVGVFFGLIHLMVGFFRFIFGGSCCGTLNGPAEKRTRCSRPNCGKMNVPGARYCAQCGQALNR